MESLGETVRPATFGRRKLTPRACVADSKRHIRTFLADALEELGFVTFECAEAADLKQALDTQTPDLVVLGLAAEGLEAKTILELLATTHFNGKILPVGLRDSVLATATRQLGAELGLPLLPILPTPFGAESLRDSVAMLLPAEAPPSPAVDVAEALKAGWLELWYQQKIDARTLIPRGAEALIRMRHPAWGVVPPAYFIPDENDRNFRSLSEFVIGRAIDDWRYFIEQNGPVDISINLPMAFLQDRETIRELCLQMPAHPAFGGLLIELKSADVIGNIDMAIDIARQIRFHNIAISIDDVGPEWPSLMGLETFPFVELKVDRQFVTGCADDRLKQTVCRGIIDLADGYGARTVAEGVESRADFLAAHEMGFDLAQGFLFGKATTAKKFARSALARPILVPQ
jgi:EAL domain-containing protein (putative c-di-GMP-specific phosphodiesterase class I)/CheY-like chemotaxis protein